MDPGAARNVGSHRDEPIGRRRVVLDGEIADGYFRAPRRCPRPRRLDGDRTDLELAGKGVVTWRGKSGDTGNREYYRSAT